MCVIERFRVMCRGPLMEMRGVVMQSEGGYSADVAITAADHNATKAGAALGDAGATASNDKRATGLVSRGTRLSRDGEYIMQL